MQELMAIYSRVHVAMFGDGEAPSAAPLQRVHYSRDAVATVLAYAGPEFVIYAVLRPDLQKAAALDPTNRLVTWLRSHQADLFVPV